MSPEQADRKKLDARSDIFAIQDEISGAIVDALRVRLDLGKGAQRVKRYTENAEAYQLYLHGRRYWNRRTDESAKRAIEYFETAIAKDPNYALAYAGLAYCYCSYVYFGGMAPAEPRAKAKAAALRALELDDTLSEAQSSFGLTRVIDFDFSGGEMAFRRSLELNPSNADARYLYGAAVLLPLGRLDEALAELDRAQILEPPFSPHQDLGRNGPLLSGGVQPGDRAAPGSNRTGAKLRPGVSGNSGSVLSNREV